MGTRLQGRRALVTGSTDGIGAAVARALAAEGAFVVVSGRNAERGSAVVDEIVADGGLAAFVACDLADGSEAIDALAHSSIEAAGGPIDVLVNNAAQLLMPSPTAQVSEESIDLALAVNVKAPFVLTGILASAMAARGTGVVVNIGSINGLVGMNGSALYSTTKAALHSMTKSWAAEFGPRGVRVNTVAPGPTMTERNASILDHLGPILAKIPSGRMSTTAEVAAAVVFLASDEATNIHGATLGVDGGFAAV